MKYVLVLVIGLAGGYYIGYNDGAAGNPSIGSRIVGRVGGKSRASVRNDIDAQMRQAEDTARAGAKRPAGKNPR